MASEKIYRSTKVIRLIILCGLVLLIGVVGMSALARMRQPPVKAVTKERPLSVEVQKAELENVPVVITGYGEVKALDVVAIAPEISGKVIYIHPRLEAGEVIPQGEVLFRIDPSDYEATLKGALAIIEQLNATILRLNKQHKMDQERLKTLERNRDLTKAQYDRIQRLFKEENVGTLAGVEQAEQAFNVTQDQVVQLTRTIELYPIQVEEAEANLASAEAKQESAKIRLRQCMVRSPFDARIKEVNLETEQYVTPGLKVLSLADDSVLEIRVPLDSRDAGQWLQFKGKRGRDQTAWFNGLEKLPCTIQWTESKADITWQGILHRVVKFDQQTRTLTVAVRIAGPNILNKNSEVMPLVEGMFCSVKIPGRTLNNVIRLPRWAVSFENTVYLANDHRLKTVPVKVARIDGEETFVSSGIKPGENVIITRLVDPLENALVIIN
ncbi:MAG: HlyD family efflux transporter periplasmic adaptor subunit [Deltaproteobacteria bacterium]|nr:HlyD family efflux transporter periplasmic adaptor subunit [Deltaproteobacteria bacterium]